MQKKQPNRFAGRVPDYDAANNRGWQGMTGQDERFGFEVMKHKHHFATKNLLRAGLNYER